MYDADKSDWEDEDYTLKSFFIYFLEKYCQILPILEYKTPRNLQKIGNPRNQKKLDREKKLLENLSP